MIAQTVKWVGGIDGVLELIDQRRLPVDFVTLRIDAVEALHEAIRTLAVRGAPAIGVAAAFGPVLSLQQVGGADRQEALEKVLAACDFLASSRPTAVNLFWALDRIRARAQETTHDPEATVRQ